MYVRDCWEKFFDTIFEVPWDQLWGTWGSILAPGHGRIFKTGDFDRLWYGVFEHTNRFSGLFFSIASASVPM